MTIAVAATPIVGSLGIDEAWTKVDPETLVANDFHCVGCYLSADPSKNWTAAIRQAYLDAGLGVMPNVEFGASFMLSPANAGPQGRQMNDLASQLGFKESTWLVLSADFDATPGQYPIIKEYLDVFASQGRPCTVYGKAALLDYIGKPGWQSMSWSYGVISAWAYLLQRYGHTRLLPGYSANSYDEDVLLQKASAIPFFEWGKNIIDNTNVTNQQQALNLGGLLLPNQPVHTAGGHVANGPAISILVDPQGRGYYEVGEDGGIYTEQAKGKPALPFYGSMGGKPLNKPIIAADIRPQGDGYIMLGADGGVFAFGNAREYGNLIGKQLNQPPTNIRFTHSGNGYFILCGDYGVQTFGDAASQYAGTE